MNSKSLLIIGARGFFGHSIIDHIFYNYKKNNIKKILLLSRGVDKVKIDKTINKRFKIIKICADISKLKKIPFADYIIYCAINYNYKEDYKSACNYFRLAKKYHKKSKILFTSSGAIYGLQPTHVNKIKENYLLRNKRLDFYDNDKNIYSITKLKNEEIFKKLGKIGIKVSIARCFTFVGKYLSRNKNYVVGNFIKNILDKKKIKIKSIHNVIRSYMHESDLVAWLFKILKNANTNCPVYNVGSDQDINIRKLAFYLSKKYKLEIESKKIKSNFKDRYIPSISKAKKELNLKLNYSSCAAIDEVINTLKNS